MLRSFCFVAVFIVFGPVSLFAQFAGQAPPNPVPIDRASDVYRIYSSLMPIGETAAAGWPHDLWLVEDTTTTLVPPDQPCDPPGDPAKMGSPMNPHNAVVPTKDRQQDYLELMQDFDLHCHERWTLAHDAWSTKVPVRLLNSDEQKEFRSMRFGLRSFADQGKFKGAPALYSFSQVYFNSAHTVALVYAEEWCGGLCANGYWVALQFENGHWKDLHWTGSVMVS